MIKQEHNWEILLDIQSPGIDDIENTDDIFERFCPLIPGYSYYR